jgi:CHASE3 domain sensor protein
MNWLKKIKLFTVLMFICSILVSASLTSCKKGDANSDATEHPEGEEHPASDSTEHPEGEHPEKSDSTNVN